MSLFMKTLLHLFNITYMIFGVICVIESKSCLGKDYEILLCTSMLPLLVGLLKTTGYLLFPVTMVGTIGVCCNHQKVIKAYTACLGLALVFMLSGFWKGFLYLAQVDQVLDRNVNLTMQINYGYAGYSDWTNSINSMQKEMHCCGYSEAGDWLQANYFIDTDPAVQAARGDMVVPQSCCHDPLNPTCADELTVDMINMNGCRAPLRRLFQETLINIGSICSGMSLLLMLNILLVFCMLSKKNEKIHPNAC